MYFGKLTLTILTTCPIHLICALAIIVTIVGKFTLANTFLLFK